jgi:hypothetical protein
LNSNEGASVLVMIGHAAWQRIMLRPHRVRS